MPSFREIALEWLLADQPVSGTPAEVPPGKWITGQLDLDQTVVVQRSPRVEIAWADAQGHLVTRPSPALYQHVFGPNLPAYTVGTPRKAGDYRLVFLDSHHHQIASKRYVVVPELRTSRQVFGKNTPDYTVSAVVVNEEKSTPDHVRVVLLNASRYYLQAHVKRDKEAGAACSHPGINAPAQGSLVLALNYMQGESTTEQVNLVLPHDLPARGRLEMDVPIEWRIGSRRPDGVRIVPQLVGVGQKTAEKGDVCVQIANGSTQPATEPISLKR
jgi:hypothetical protein